MSEQQQPRKIGQAVNDFGQLKARQVSIHQWRVLSWRNDSITAHKVDLLELTCSCEDEQYNNTGGSEVCDHIVTALYQAERTMDVGEALNHELHEQVHELNEHVQAIERRAAGVKADAAAADAKSTSDSQASSNGSEPAYDGDPEDDFRSLLLDAGMDPANFDWWVDDQYGSLQATEDAYLEDEEFEMWVNFKEEIGMQYDGDEDVSYLNPADFPEVFG